MISKHLNEEDEKLSLIFLADFSNSKCVIVRKLQFFQVFAFHTYMRHFFCVIGTKKHKRNRERMLSEYH